VVRGSIVSDLAAPLTCKVTGTGNDESCTAGELESVPAALAASGATAVPAALAMNVRRLNPDVCGGLVVSFITVSAAGEKQRSPRTPYRFNNNNGIGFRTDRQRESNGAGICGQLSLMEHDGKCEQRAS
jgi:L-lactate permease